MRNNIDISMVNHTQLYAKKMVASLKYPFSTSIVIKSAPFALLLTSNKKEIPVDMTALRPDPRDVMNKGLFTNQKGVDVIVLFEKVKSGNSKIKIPKYIIFNREVIIINSRLI